MKPFQKIKIAQSVMIRVSFRQQFTQHFQGGLSEKNRYAFAEIDGLMQHTPYLLFMHSRLGDDCDGVCIQLFDRLHDQTVA